MANLRWFRLLAVDVPAATADSTPRHEAESGGCKLSMFWNQAGTEALMKVDGAGKEWRRGKTWITTAAALGPVYDRSNHDDIFSWFYTPEWQPPE